MKHVRDTYLRHSIVPRQTMKDFLNIGKLTVQDYGGRVVTIHSVSPQYESILEFAKLMGIPYRGEGLPGITLQTLLKLVKPVRKNPSKTLRNEIIEEQHGKCAKCGTECRLEMDHVHQIATDPFNRNGKDNLVGLAPNATWPRTWRNPRLLRITLS